MTAHPESVTAVLTDNEPPDGTKLVLLENGCDWRVILREDQIAKENGYGERRWYNGDSLGDEEPRTLHDWLKDADAVYALGGQLAVFR